MKALVQRCGFSIASNSSRMLSEERRFERKTPIVSGFPILYTTATEHQMTLLNKVFTTGTLVKIILVLTAIVAMKAASLHYDFSWATALAAE